MHFRTLVFGALLAFGSLQLSSASAQQTERQDAEARTLFGLGNTAYLEGRYRAALDYFQQAYDLSHRAQLLFNIGQAADRLREDRRALEAFEAYLREVPESPDREAIVARVEILRATIERSTASPALTPSEPAETAASENETATESAAPAVSTEAEGGSSTAGIVIASGGGAMLVVGVALLAVGMHDASSVEGAPDGTAFVDVSSEYDRAPTRIGVGTVLAGVGVAATATGIVLALRGRRGSTDSASLQLQVRPMGLSLRGTF